MKIINIQNILNYIDNIKCQSGYANPVFEFTHGKCYIFAQKLQNKVGGEILYIPVYEHIVLLNKGYIFDATGNVTKKYANEKQITMQELKKRKKIYDSFEKIE